jgi:hypothetical protein
MEVSGQLHAPGALCVIKLICTSESGIAQWYSAGLRAEWSPVRVQAGAGNSSLHRRFQIGSGAHPASCPMGIRGSSPRGKAPGREADHSSPASAEVKKAWSYTSTPPMNLHGVVLG